MTAEAPYREVRAEYDDESITVYQAYPPAIADAALAAGTFVPPFKRERMTWIKPSFRWMMYRSGWATKPGQERVLAVRISRVGFEWALGRACLSHQDGARHGSAAAWRADLAASPVRVQWDPERSTSGPPLPHRAVQIGLSGEAVARYVEEWIRGLEDMTGLARETQALVRAGRWADADARIPAERPYPLPEPLRSRIAASPPRKDDV